MVLSFCPVFHSGGACVQLAFVVLLASTFVCRVLFAVGLSGVLFKELGDRGLDTSEGRGVEALIHYAFELF